MSINRAFLKLPLLALALAAAPAGAVTLTGSYTTGGATTGTGPWTLTSTDSTFSVLRFVFDTPISFGDMTSLSVDYVNNLGGIGGGAPRIAMITSGGNFEINFGPAGSFVDPTLGAGNTGNLLALTDVGRYNLSGIGGSQYTDRTAALSLASGFNVLRASLILDSFGGNNRNFTINGISAEGATGAVPEPATWAMMIIGFGLVGCTMRRKQRSTVSYNFA
jgi:hypothetical protein